MERQYRRQVIELGQAANAVANTTIESSVQLDKDYNRIIGIGFFETANGGAAAELYNVGARDKRRTWVDDINVNAWDANSGVGPDDKMMKTNIPYASGDTFYGRVIPTVNTNSALTGQMVLLLARDLTEIPK